MKTLKYSRQRESIKALPDEPEGSSDRPTPFTPASGNSFRISALEPFTAI